MTKKTHSRTLTSEAAGELHVLGKDRHAFRVNSTQVRIFEETDQVRFRCFLERENGARLETQVRLEVLRDFSDEALERHLPNQEIGRFLVFPYLA